MNGHRLLYIRLKLRTYSHILYSHLYKSINNLHKFVFKLNKFYAKSLYYTLCFYLRINFINCGRYGICM